jgi:hypothetical protein
MRERTKVIMGAVTAVWPQETGPRRGLTLATRRVPYSFQQMLIKAVEAVLRGIISPDIRGVISPDNTQATLGTFIRDLHNDAHNSSSS